MTISQLKELSNEELRCRVAEENEEPEPVTIHIEVISKPNDPTLRACQPQWEGSDLSFLDEH